MKKIFSIIALSTLIFFSCNTDGGTAKATFKVWGNCEMCKETIETSLKKDGIASANWNTETKMIEVQYDDKKITLEKIHDQIASVGYDTELKKGSDEAYANLPGCCQYERK